MNVRFFRVSVLLGAAFACLASTGSFAAVTDLADVPMVVKNGVKANVLSVFDNSQSMDAFMAGKLVTGTDPNTRGNIGRRVLSNIVTRYRSNFNWGLMSFELKDRNPGLYNTYAYYFGDTAGMVFTNDCVAGVSASNGNRGCVANPQPFPGGNYVTYDRSGDDPDILDVLYYPGVFSQLWGPTGAGTCFNEYLSHNPVNSWNSSSFSSYAGNFCYTPTDAGFTVSNPPYPRQLYVPRGLGYLSDITGKGSLIAPVQADVPGPPPYPSIIAALQPETVDRFSSELKNAALFTPLYGTLRSAKSYFSSVSEEDEPASPIKYACQRNFVMLVTDGAPTGDLSGNLYSGSARTNSYDAVSGTWTFGRASQDAIDAVAALRTTILGGRTYDIQTYVVGLGDTVQNPSAVATLNAMAAKGGTTSAYLATSEAELLASLDVVSQDIISKDGAAAAVTVSNPNIVAGDNASYQSSFNSGNWTGDLESFPINLTTGVVDRSAPNWASSARTQLNSLTASGRLIASYSGSQGIQFRPSSDPATTKLTAAQEAVFNSPVSPPGPSDSAAVISYLRGDRSNEGTLYRTRAHLLGDLVDAEPLLVRSPNQNYADACYSSSGPGCVTSFKAAQSGRTRVVFQGSNDGMLHAFSAATGAELWAYIPKLVWPNLNVLTRKTGFTHLYRVDGTPITGDVDFTATVGAAAGNPNWRTLVVGGLGKGGQGYYALDVTNPVAASEADAASKVLWEFPNASTPAAVAANQGYSYGRPILTKTAGAGWVVLIASGYNNDASTTGGDGQGHLFVLNPRTGALIRDIPTGAGTPMSPSGLAKISAYSANQAINNTTDFVYGGDLLGNVWRFDLTSTNPATWSVAKLATLVDGSGTRQAVTTEPQLSEITRGGISRRFVYVGTGSYLGDSDVATTQTQSMYGLIDDLSASPLISPLRSRLQRQIISNVGGGKRQLSRIALDYATQRGWYVDFNLSAGERINTDPQLARGALIFTTNIPSADKCVPGGSSFFYVLDYENGGVLTNTTQPLYSGMFLGNAMASRPTLVQLPNGKVVTPVHLTDGTVPTPENGLPPTGPLGARRVFWKEIITN